MQRIAEVGLALVLLMLAAVGVGCASSTASDHPAVVVIQELLELRRDDVRDAEAYEPYFPDAALAEELASGSDEPTGTPQVPEHELPYLTAETTSTADVAVVWKASDDFPDWPVATVFVLSQLDDRWVVVDALEATSAPKPLGE